MGGEHRDSEPSRGPSDAAPDAAGVHPEAPAVGRLAPSPTGPLHLGHARSFLLAWWHARSRGARVVLRIEDLDVQRCRPEYTELLLRDLAWLGLDWDGEPIVQSGQPVAAEEAIERLLATGDAYACVCSRSEIAASAPQGEPSSRYPGTCRDRFASPSAARLESGRAPGLRFRVAPGPVRFTDRLHGPQSMDVAAATGDFLIRRRDGVLAYQLAVVVDDARDGVTEVLRGDDLLDSTPRQMLLYAALGLAPPTWIHVPLVVDPGGRRLAKRDGDLGLVRLRERGVDSRAVVAWAARSAGLGACLPRSGLASAAELAPHFRLDRVRRQPVPVDPANFLTAPKS